MQKIVDRCSGARENIGLLLADIAAASLSTRLRTQTAPLHEQIDVLLGLPGAIRTLDDYRCWLSQFFGLYGPLEQSLERFSEWGHHGFTLPLPNHSARLAADLHAIGVDPASVSRAPATLLPRLPTFAHALGALYVLEGSTLGGRVILRDVEARIGPQITGATQFFSGGGVAAGQTWRIFKTTLDAFGHECPTLWSDTISGAESVFHAITAWFVSLRVATGRRS